MALDTIKISDASELRLKLNPCESISLLTLLLWQTTVIFVKELWKL